MHVSVSVPVLCLCPCPCPCVRVCVCVCVWVCVCVCVCVQEEDGVRPDGHSYNAMINACAHEARGDMGQFFLAFMLRYANGARYHLQQSHASHVKEPYILGLII